MSPGVGSNAQDVRLQRNTAGDQTFILDLGSVLLVESVEVQNSYTPWCNTSPSYAENYEIVITSDAAVASGLGGVATSACDSTGWRFASLGGVTGRYVVISHPASTWSMVSGFRVAGGAVPTPTPVAATPTPVSSGPCSWEFGGVVEPEPTACPEALPASGVTRDDVQVVGQLVAVVVIVGTAGLVRSFGPGSAHFS